MAEAETTTDTTAIGASTGDYEVPEWLSLDSDEEIVWVGEPALISLAGTAIWGVVLLVVLIGALILILLPFSYLSLKNTDFVITNKALYVKKGVLSTNIESVGLDKIQNTEYSQSFWGKQFGFGSIDISTAGSSGAEITFQNVENAKEVRETITRLSNEYADRSRRSGAGGAGEGEGPGDRPADDRMDELIEELRATRKAMENVEAAIRETGGSGPRKDSEAESKIEWESDEG